LKAEQISEYLVNPAALAGANPGDFSKLAEEFPYFQTAHLLLAISSKEKDSSLFQKSIKKTAIVSVSRSRLYELLYKKSLPVYQETTNELKKPDEVEVVTQQTATEQIDTPVHSSAKEENYPEIKNAELILQVEKEVEKEIVESFIEKQVLKTHQVNEKPKKEIPSTNSFTGWLELMKQQQDVSIEGGTPLTAKKDMQEEQETVQKTDSKPEIKKKKNHKQELLDKIIEMNPGAIKLKQDSKFFAANQKAKESLVENEDLVTETLAKIYALQGNTSKAIRAYQILSLKFPNKSAYFASQIEHLKKNH